MRRVVRLKHLNKSGRWASGNPRLYYRPKGQKGIALPDLPMDHPDFLAAYIAAAGHKPDLPRHDEPTGSIGAGVIAYLASDKYLGLATSTRELWRRHADAIRTAYGAGELDTLRARHIRLDIAGMAPNPAIARLKIWRSMCKFWAQKGMIEVNVARDVEPPERPANTGHTAWTRDDFATYRKHWPIGTAQRLAFEVMYHTCAAIGDACQIGPQNIADGWLTYRRQKTGSLAVVPWGEAPAWLEATDDLQRCLDAAPAHMAFLVTRSGKARSAKAAGSWFSKSCTAAGLPNLSAHGIRKGRAAMFKENGATEDQRMAILGHETPSEAQRYARSADLKRIVTGTEKFQLSNRVQLAAEKGN